MKRLRTILLAAIASCRGAVAQLEPSPPPALPDRPNIVLIVAEDIGPTLGCYGDRIARTPHLDRLAEEGVRFTRAFTHTAVCAPSRCGLVTGMYPTHLGAQHMRSRLVQPPPMFTQQLQHAGYHVRWPGKLDFNFDPPADAFSNRERWADEAAIRSLPQPFFAFVNLNATHESRLHGVDFDKVTASLTVRTQPQDVRVPAYLPDVPEVRRSIAQHYDTIAALDAEVGRILDLIDHAGLRDRTVVLFVSDHGWGMPRGKRWCYDSGTRVPMLVRWPGRIAPGIVRDDLVAFVDLAPTFLALAGAQTPEHLHGQPLLTPQGAPTDSPRRVVFACRDRMDEAPDRIRSARDQRYLYIRNLHPELRYDQPIDFVERHPVMQTMRRLHADGQLPGPPDRFFATKPPEELYDTHADPDQIVNLVESSLPEHQAALRELRAALDDWQRRFDTLGDVEESELIRRGVLQTSPTTSPAHAPN